MSKADTNQVGTSRLEHFVKENLGFELLPHQVEFLRLLAEGWADGKMVIYKQDRLQGRTATIKALGEYLKEELKTAP